MCEREWEVLLKMEMEFWSCSAGEREVRVSIYRWGSKTSCFPLFCSKPVEPPLAGVADYLPV
jgi:hypothetical protein